MRRALADSTADADIATRRAEVIGDRVSIAELARINNQSERSVYQAIDRHRIPFIKVGSERFLRPEDYAQRRGRTGDEPFPPPELALEPPRRPGRPRSAAPTATPPATRRRAP